MTNKIINLRNSETVVENLCIARTGLSRLKGLLFTKELRKGCGMWLVPCSGIHSFGMAYAIDAVYLDRNKRVVRLVKNLRPNRFAPVSWKTHSVLELPDGTLDQLDILAGDTLEIISC